MPDTSSLPSPISDHRTRGSEEVSSPVRERDRDRDREQDRDRGKKTKIFRLLHSAEEFGISIDAYKVKLSGLKCSTRLVRIYCLTLLV
jgi:hypothetical protein